MPTLTLSNYRGEAPLIAEHLLPAGMATRAVNAKLMTGNFAGFKDIGNPFQLAKAAPINTLFKIDDKYLQWSQSEVVVGTNIDATFGVIPGDPSARTFITGLDVPRWTNRYYATDPSQQGTNVLHAYPYVTFPLGLANPTGAPVASAPSAAGVTTDYDYAQLASVNDATVLVAGAGYKVDQRLTIVGGTISTGMPAAQIKITSVDSNGGVTGLTVLTSGFYDTGLGPTSPATTTGGTGTGLQLTIATVANSFAGFGVGTYDNGAGSYIHWDLSGNKWHVVTGQGDLSAAYSLGAFSLSSAASISFQADFVPYYGNPQPDGMFYLVGTFDGLRRVAGSALCLSASSGSFTLFSTFSGTNGGPISGTVVSEVTGLNLPALGTTFRVKAVLTAQSASSTPGFTVVADAYTNTDNYTTSFATVRGFIPYAGENLGVGTNHRGNHDDACSADFYNVLISVAQSSSEISTDIVNYVYTYVSKYQLDATETFTQEFGPSDPSNTITVYIDGSTTPDTFGPATVVIPPTPTGDNIAYYNLYRTVVQPDGTSAYTFVSQIAANTSASVTYTDTALDSDLTGATLLPSADWLPPPPNLQGVTAATNGIMGGFYGNTLRLCAQNYPQAWPAGNAYPTADPIVAITIFGNTFLILTSGNPYTAYGNDPAYFSMNKEPAAQGCVSKRSVATHKVYGAIYASGNGLCYYRGQGDFDLIRISNISGDKQPLFTDEQWKALNPSSIISEIHDDYYYFSYDNGAKKGSYLLDLKANGFGIVELDFHVTCFYVDTSKDTLYLVPDYSTLPINGNVVATAQNVVSQWAYSGSTTTRNKVWERANILMGEPTTFQLCRVRAVDYSDITLKITADGVTVYDGVVINNKPFRILAGNPSTLFTITQGGTSEQKVLELVTQATEFAK